MLEHLSTETITRICDRAEVHDTVQHLPCDMVPCIDGFPVEFFREN